MAWSTPLTAVANAALTAAQWNASVRDNLLETGPAKASGASRFLVTTGVNTITERGPLSNFQGGTGETTASTVYTDLTTVGPTCGPTTTGTVAIIAVTANAWNNTLGAYAHASIAVSGASTIATSDSRALSIRSSTADTNAGFRGSYVDILTGLTNGSNTFKMQYRVPSGTGRWDQRTLMVIPM